MLLCPAQCLSKVVFFLHFSCFLNAALCKLNYLQVIRIFSKVSLTYSFSRLFCIFLGFYYETSVPLYLSCIRHGIDKLKSIGVIYQQVDFTLLTWSELS